MESNGVNGIESISAEFAAAFLAVQMEMENPAKSQKVTVNTTKGKYEYCYAKLDDTMKCVKVALHKHGITVTQPAASRDGLVGIRTELTYQTGETWDRGTLLMKASDDPQKVGTVLTYLRRYGLSSAVGIVAEDDDDGRRAQEDEGESGGGTRRRATPKNKPAGKKRTPTEHIKSITDHYGLFMKAYGAEKAEKELIAASRYEKKDAQGNKTGEWAEGYTTPKDMIARAKDVGLNRAAVQLRVICHIIEASYAKALKEDEQK